MCQYSCKLEFPGGGIAGGCESLDANSCCLQEYHYACVATELALVPKVCVAQVDLNS